MDGSVRGFLVAALLWGLSFPLAGWAAPVRVVASVPPIAALVEAVGGDQVEVLSMARPGDNPATYHPSPRQIQWAANADLVVFAGLPFERLWLDRLRALGSQRHWLDARHGVMGAVASAAHSEAEEGHDHAHGLDPHVWTSPVAARVIAANIRDALIEIDPAHRSLYAQRFKRLAERLDALDRRIGELLQQSGVRRFMVFHPAWGYFARRYGLTQVAIEHEGKSPGARSLARVIEAARAAHVQVIFVQPQFSQRLARQIARAIGGRVVVLDPLSARYPDNLLEAAKQIAGVADE